MSLLKTLQSYIPLGKKPTLPRRDTLALRPIRNTLIRWEATDNEAPGVRLNVPRKQDQLAQLLTKYMGYPTHKVIELDEFGAAVWVRCDGDHTVEQIVSHTSSTYKLNRRQAEVSVLAFLKTLGQRQLIGFTLPPSADKKPAKGKEHYGKPRQRAARRPRRAAWRRH